MLLDLKVLGKGYAVWLCKVNMAVGKANRLKNSYLLKQYPPQIVYSENGGHLTKLHSRVWTGAVAVWPELGRLIG